MTVSRRAWSYSAAITPPAIALVTAAKSGDSAILAAGRVYVLARDGTMSVIKSGRNFELLAANTLDDNFTASPVVSNGRLYLRGFRSLYAIGEGSKER